MTVSSLSFKLRQLNTGLTQRLESSLYHSYLNVSLAVPPCVYANFVGTQFLGSDHVIGNNVRPRAFSQKMAVKRGIAYFLE